MSQECAICGKSSHVGNTIVRHGLPKKSGGIGLHTTGINKRRFKANIQRVKVNQAGTTRTIRVCTGCIKAGKIVKACRVVKT